MQGLPLKLNLTKLSEFVAQASDRFDAQYETIDTVVGLIDSALRKQGIDADAVTIDCPSIDKKIVFLLHDEKPNSVSIAFGNKAGDIDSSVDYELDTISVDLVFTLLIENFTDN